MSWLVSRAFVPKVGGLTLSLWLYSMLVNTQPKIHRQRISHIEIEKKKFHASLSPGNQRARERGKMKDMEVHIGERLAEFKILKSWTEASTVMQERK